MHFGVCGDPRVASVAARESYDFAEWTVAELLKPREPESEFRAALNEVRGAEIPYPVLNQFIPGDLKITGPDVGFTELREYVTVACKRAEQAQVEVIVFGSGGARQVPEGFDAQLAHEQLVTFCSMAAPIAGDHGVTIVVEPLCVAACNVLNTVSECAALVREVSHPSFRLLVDAYHLMKDGDSYDDIVAHAELLSHAHIATPANRLTPGAEPCDFAQFFAALATGGYDQRISIESRIADPEKELRKALLLMRRLVESAQVIGGRQL